MVGSAVGAQPGQEVARSRTRRGHRRPAGTGRTRLRFAVATLGAFAVVYGEGRPYRVRWRIVALVGVALVVLAGIGATVGGLVHAREASPIWWLLMVGVMTVVVAVGAYVVDALRTGPPGAFLPLLCVVIASTLPAAGVPVVSALGWTALGAASALAVAMSGFPFRPRTPERAAVGSAVCDVEAMLAENTPNRRRDAVRSLHGAWQCLHDAGLVKPVTDGPPHALTQTLHAAHLRCAAALHGVPHAAASLEDDLHAQVPLRRPPIRHLLTRAWHPHGRTTTILVRLLVACPTGWWARTAPSIGSSGPSSVSCSSSPCRSSSSGVWCWCWFSPC
jgi:hypothetical protein